MRAWRLTPGRLAKVALLGVLTGFAAGEAAAATVSVDVGTQVHTTDGEMSSPTLGLRLGKELDLKVARIVPEVGIVGVPGTSFVGVIGGARLSVLRFIEPGAYAHLGYGGVFGDSGWGTADAGLQLDLALAHVRAGVHGGVEVHQSASELEPFLTVGLHTGIVF
jgi:hypothetical protein